MLFNTTLTELVLLEVIAPVQMVKFMALVTRIITVVLWLVMVELALRVTAVTVLHGRKSQSLVEALEAAKEMLLKRMFLELVLGVDHVHVQTALFIGSVITIMGVALLLVMGVHLDNAIDTMAFGEVDESLATKGS